MLLLSISATISSARSNTPSVALCIIIHSTHVIITEEQNRNNFSFLVMHMPPANGPQCASVADSLFGSVIGSLFGSVIGSVVGSVIVLVRISLQQNIPLCACANLYCAPPIVPARFLPRLLPRQNAANTGTDTPSYISALARANERNAARANEMHILS